jgi:hypothetical protein
MARLHEEAIPMIEVRGRNDDLTVLISGKEADIMDAGEGYALAECNFSDLAAEQSCRRGHESTHQSRHAAFSKEHQ